MSQIALGYGKSHIDFEYDENRFEVLGDRQGMHALSDAEIGERLDSPIDSPNLEEIVNPGESVLIVVPDATRRSASGQIVNLLVRRLIANGTMPHDIRCIFATGIHRAVTNEEAQTILTPFINQRIKTLHHGPRDLVSLAQFGETNHGTPIELNRALKEHDHVITIGSVGFHYFAGFTGGRKLICPGLASSRTISASHKLAFDFEQKTRREGVGTGLLGGNAVHEEFMEIVEKCPPSFSINTIVNRDGNAAEIFAGNWKTAHQKACEFYAEKNTVAIAKKREVVVVSCGGGPFDINMIQAHKALDAAANACVDGGTIIWLAECSEGMGRADFLKWFEAENSGALAEKLCEGYQVNGQTAWALLKKAERFRIRIITNLTQEETRQMQLQKARGLDEIPAGLKGYILPFGAEIFIKS